MFQWRFIFIIFPLICGGLANVLPPGQGHCYPDNDGILNFDIDKVIYYIVELKCVILKIYCNLFFQFMGKWYEAGMVKHFYSQNSRNCRWVTFTKGDDDSLFHAQYAKTNGSDVIVDERNDTINVSPSSNGKSTFTFNAGKEGSMVTNIVTDYENYAVVWSCFEFPWSKMSKSLVVYTELNTWIIIYSSLSFSWNYDLFSYYKLEFKKPRNCRWNSSTISQQ